jgi:hypothetical protein
MRGSARAALHDGLRQGTSSIVVVNVGDAMMRSVTMGVALAAHIASRRDQRGHIEGPPRAGASARYPHTMQRLMCAGIKRIDMHAIVPCNLSWGVNTGA